MAAYETFQTETVAPLACISRQARGRIDERLDAIERDHAVRVLLAVEAGSRAWGLPLSGGDHDVRFVFARRPESYLSVEVLGDVVKLPDDDGLEVTGWDIRKALSLLATAHPVLLEWLRSPIVYRADGEAMVKFLDLAQEAAGQRPAAYHYLHLCKERYRRFIERRNRVRLLKYFDVLHPALGLRWLRGNPARPVPADFGALWAGLDLPAGFSACLEATLLHKARHRDLGRGPRLVVLDALIEEEIALAEGTLPEEDSSSASLRQQADALFRDLVLRSA